jgi:hypothetical protein
MSVESLARNEMKQRVRFSSTRRRYTDPPNSICLAADDPNFAMISDETYSEFYWDVSKKCWARWVMLSIPSGFCLFEPSAHK